ncbi:MAG: c-type cytochrome [Bacteroidetes bacterium]|nr:c-type cytochrome [Bacteroidota bacterium]
MNKIQIGKSIVFLGIGIYSGAVIFLTDGCKKPDHSDLQAPFETTPYTLEYGKLPDPNIPEDNRLTKEGVELGRMLFYERALSGDGTQACSDCHRQKNAFSDTAQFSTGIAGTMGTRQAMAVFNMLWNSNEFFWDGRAHLLRDQSLMPIQNPVEMNETLENVVTKLEAMDSYTGMFEKAFGTKTITPERISLAMEQFMNSIVSYNSKFDQVQAGQAKFTPSEEKGRKLFFAEYNPAFPDITGADCAHCHGGFNFENDRYMNNGLDDGGQMMDMGREEVTHDMMDRGKFKVPSLRNIALTPPYMHDGRFATLEEVVDHYNTGIHNSPTLDPALKNTMSTGLMLDTQEKADLIAFLKTLSDFTLVNDVRYSDPH